MTRVKFHVILCVFLLFFFVSLQFYDYLCFIVIFLWWGREQYVNQTHICNSKLHQLRVSFQSSKTSLTVAMLNTLRCHTHFWFSANLRLLDPDCWYKFIYLMANSANPDFFFFRSQLIWIYTVCKGRTYLGSAELRITLIFKTRHALSLQTVQI